MSMIPRARFAPSPTGYLHVGGARTALFNYLWARKLGGKFVLRIEDTDQTRNVQAADAKLLEDLRWLGLQWDEGPETGGEFGPYHQSQRLKDYNEHARRLLDSGNAYYAFDTREELDAMRKAAEKAKRPFRYPRPASFPSEGDAEKARASGRTVVIRFKMPDHDFTVRDTILGEVTVAAAQLDDFVIVKGDGWPTYHFAVVVDDELMRITHVMRGVEHLMNTPKHLGLQEAFGYRTPAYAHLPLIFNMDGGKMSKREKDKVVRAAFTAAVAAGKIDAAQGPELAGGVEPAAFEAWRGEVTQLESHHLRKLAVRLGVTLPEIDIHDFRASGYLPEVLLNFIALLGWSPGEDREKFTLTDMCELFTVERIGKTNARFDREKLLNFNTVALAAASPVRKLAGIRDYLATRDDSPLTKLDDATLDRLIAMNEGLRIFSDVEDKSAVLFIPDEQLVFDDAAVQKVLLKGGIEVIRDILPQLETVTPWTVAALDQAIRSFGDARKLGLGKVAQPLRVAVTGRTVSPPIFDTLEVLGRERTLARLRRTLARFAT